MIDYDYRRASSAWTGRAPRSVEERWPACPVVAEKPGFWYRVLLFITGH